jgi:hypothetical protein
MLEIRALCYPMQDSLGLCCILRIRAGSREHASLKRPPRTGEEEAS